MNEDGTAINGHDSQIQIPNKDDQFGQVSLLLGNKFIRTMMQNPDRNRYCYRSIRKMSQVVQHLNRIIL